MSEFNNHIYGGNNLFGDNGVQNNYGTSPADLRPLLVDLVAQIQAHSAELPLQVRQDAETALADLDNRKGGPKRLRTWMERVMVGAGDTATIAESAGKIITAIDSITSS